MEDKKPSNAENNNISSEEYWEQKGKGWEKTADEWSNKADSWGKELGRKIEEKIPKFVEGLAGAIATAVVMILINLYYDQIGFLSPEFEKVLPIINFSFIVGIIINLSTVFIHNKQYKRITNIISNIIFFFVAYAVWIIFPFDTSVIGDQETWDKIFRSIIALTVLAVGIGTIAEIVKLITNKKDPC